MSSTSTPITSWSWPKTSSLGYCQRRVFSRSTLAFGSCLSVATLFRTSAAKPLSIRYHYPWGLFSSVVKGRPSFTNPGAWRNLRNGQKHLAFERRCKTYWWKRTSTVGVGNYFIRSDDVGSVIPRASHPPVYLHRAEFRRMRTVHRRWQAKEISSAKKGKS